MASILQKLVQDHIANLTKQKVQTEKDIEQSVAEIQEATAMIEKHTSLLADFTSQKGEAERAREKSEAKAKEINGQILEAEAELRVSHHHQRPEPY